MDSDRPNIVLISIDTLRADGLGSYGYKRPFISPNLDRLARNGVRFQQAISHSPWTTPSHMSMFTSMAPSSHLVNESWEHFDEFLQHGEGYRVLPDHVVTVTEQLKREGYKTLAMTGGTTMRGEIGFDQGFDVYEERPENLDQWELILNLLDQGEQEPFFLFLHTFEVHAPYSRLDYAQPLLKDETTTALKTLFWYGPDVIRRLPRLLEEHGQLNADVLSAMYDGGIRYADVRMGLIFEELQARGLYDNTVIIVTSDHGEEFADHSPIRFYDAHCTTTYDELLHVPLIIRLPGDRGAGLEPTQQVGLIDIAPTILDLAGAETPATMQGRSLRPILWGGELDEDRPTLSEATCSGPEMKSIRTGTHKYIAAFEREESDWRNPLWEQVFNLEQDPDELNDLQDKYPQLLEHLRAEFQAQLDHAQSVAVSESPRMDVDQKQRDRLRSLGYIQ